MKFEDLPVFVQARAAKTLQMIMIRTNIESTAMARNTASVVREAFVELFNEKHKPDREKDISSLMGILADNPHLTINEALDVFRSKDVTIEKASKIISDFAQRRAEEAP